MTANMIKSLLIAALLSCASARAVQPDPEDGNNGASFKISDMQCQLVQGQIRCTFGGRRHG